MPRVRESLEELHDKADVCIRCLSNTWNPVCRSCGKYLCEPCFQFSENKCCAEYNIVNKQGVKLIPHLPRSVR